MKYFIPLVCIILVISSCNPRRSEVCNRWVLMEKKGSISPEEKRNLLNLSISLPVRIFNYTDDPLSGSFINFSFSGKYNMRLSTLYSEGSWNMENDSTIMLVASTSDSIPLRIVSLKKDTCSLYFISGHSFASYLNYFSNDAPITFISDTISYWFKANPYSFGKNKWAVKAKHKLNEKEIRDKLKNYLDYLITILKDQRDNSSYLEKIANPVRLAANGISLVGKDIVDPEWQNIFYDQAGFDTAYSILQNTFDCDIKLKHDVDFTDLDSDILRQMRLIITREKRCPCKF